MRTLALIVFFIALPLASGSFTPERESEYWENSGIDTALAERLISNLLCQHDEQYFESCRQALLKGTELSRRHAEFVVLRNLRYPSKFDFEVQLRKLISTVRPEQSQALFLGRIITKQLSVFDRYAQVLPAGFYRLILNGESKTYFGLGLETEQSAAGLFVFRVAPNTIAHSAGIKVYDRIVSINGKSVSVANLTGKRGERIILEIERSGQLLKFDLHISAITTRDMEESRLTIDGKIYSHLRLFRFGEGSCARVQSAIENLSELKESLGGVILDLRHNPGGFVKEGQCVAQLFAGDVEVLKRKSVKLRFPEGLVMPTPTSLEHSNFFDRPSSHKNFQLVVLVDASSQSMAEVVAGALQGYGRGWIVGERTYGKSSTQLALPVVGYPKLRLLHTVGRFQLPDAFARGEPGVTPDYEVPSQAQASHSRRTYPREVERIHPAPHRKLPKHLPPCLTSRHLDRKNRDRVIQNTGFEDNQMTFALDLLECLN